MRNHRLGRVVFGFGSVPQLLEQLDRTFAFDIQELGKVVLRAIAQVVAPFDIGNKRIQKAIRLFSRGHVGKFILDTCRRLAFFAARRINLPGEAATFGVVDNRSLNVVYGNITHRAKPVYHIVAINQLVRHEHFDIGGHREVHVVMQLGIRDSNTTVPSTHSFRLQFQSHDIGIQI